LELPSLRSTITPKASGLTDEHCPRCWARSGIRIHLFASTFPADELYSVDAVCVAGWLDVRRLPTGGRSVSRALAPEPLVTRWVDAFNARDIEGMLVCLDPDVRFHPLRLGGLDGSYRGHDDVRRWLARRTLLRHEHVMVMSDVNRAGDGKVLAAGALSLVGDLEIAPFRALHAIADGMIAAAHHYVTDPDMLECLGLVR
jgi:ketosteroid isomerase-like protein